MTFQKNKTNDVLVNFVLDGSGSMQTVRGGTVEGFNSFIQDQVNETEGNVYVSLTVFNTSFDVRFVAREASEVPRLGDFSNPYRPTGGTALFDATGVAITGAEEWLRNHPNFTGKVVTVVWTDGAENSSRRYNQGSINELIETKQNQGWVFQFMGTGEEGWRSNECFTAIPVHQRGWTVRSGGGMYAGAQSLSSSVKNLRGGGAYAYDQALTNSLTENRGDNN